MTHIFLCHATQDRAAAESLVKALEQSGVRCWVSFRDIRHGENWDKAINSALSTASAVVILCSHDAIESTYVQAEVEFALTRKKAVVPVLLQTGLDLPLRWRMIQWVDAHDLRFDDRFARALVAALPRTLENQLNAAISTQDRVGIIALVKGNLRWLDPNFTDATLLFSGDQSPHDSIDIGGKTFIGRFRSWLSGSECSIDKSKSLIDAVKQPDLIVFSDHQFHMYSQASAVACIVFFSSLDGYASEEAVRSEVSSVTPAVSAAIAKAATKLADYRRKQFLIHLYYGRRAQMGDAESALRELLQKEMMQAMQLDVEEKKIAGTTIFQIHTYDRLLANSKAVAN